MAKFYDRLNDELRAFIAEQAVFFVATAPPDGRINLSPKGMDTFHCFDDTTVGYLDLTGSGNETAAHLHLDDRLTVLFCSFTRKPQILRLYGRGRIVARGTEEWDRLTGSVAVESGARQLMVLDVDSVQTSCGYGVPVAPGGLEERPTLRKWAEAKGSDGLVAYRQEKNLRSIDGHPTHLLPD